MILGLCKGFIGIMEKKMETTRVHSPIVYLMYYYTAIVY